MALLKELNELFDGQDQADTASGPRRSRKRLHEECAIPVAPGTKTRPAVLVAGGGAEPRRSSCARVPADDLWGAEPLARGAAKNSPRTRARHPVQLPFPFPAALSRTQDRGGGECGHERRQEQSGGRCDVGRRHGPRGGHRRRRDARREFHGGARDRPRRREPRRRSTPSSPTRGRRCKPGPRGKVRRPPPAPRPRPEPALHVERRGRTGARPEAGTGQDLRALGLPVPLLLEGRSDPQEAPRRVPERRADHLEELPAGPCTPRCWPRTRPPNRPTGRGSSGRCTTYSSPTRSSSSRSSSRSTRLNWGSMSAASRPTALRRRFARASTPTTREVAALGVNGAPGFFINGRFLSGAQPYEVFKQMVDEELAQK